MRFAVNGTIVANDDAAMIRWCGLQDLWPVVCPQDLRDALDSLPAGETLEMEINSGGGDLMAGFEMYSLLHGTDKPTTAIIQSMAGSAASVICVGADRVQCAPVGQMMIHLPMTSTEGNQIAHGQSIQMLDAATESILNAYVAKCGGRATREQLRGQMAAETFLTAQQALEMGLVDEILTPGGAPAVRLVNSIGRLPDLTNLRAAYLAAHGTQTPPQTPPPQTENHTIQTARARLALERIRL